MRQFAFLYGVASDKDPKTNLLFYGYLEKEQGKHLFYLWELLQPAPSSLNSLSKPVALLLLGAGSRSQQKPATGWGEVTGDQEPLRLLPPKP